MDLVAALLRLVKREQAELELGCTLEQDLPGLTVEQVVKAELELCWAQVLGRYQFDCNSMSFQS